MNRVLDPNFMGDSQAVMLAALAERCGAVWQRKAPGAHIRYLWASLMYDCSKPGRCLVVGGYEDPIVPYLSELLPAWARAVAVVDPHVDGQTLHEYSDRTDEAFDYIFALSVLEHVEDDALFLQQISDLLVPGGLACLTCDFREGWKEGDPKDPTEFRLYTAESLRRITDGLKDTVIWVGDRDWSNPYGNYFHYGDRDYAFATIAFRKRGV